MKIKLKKFISIFMLSLCVFSSVSVSAMKPVKNQCKKQKIPIFPSDPFEEILMPYDLMSSFVQKTDLAKEANQQRVYYNNMPVLLLSLKSFEGYIRDLYIYSDSLLEIHFDSFSILNRKIEKVGMRTNDIDNVIYTQGSFSKLFIFRFVRESRKEGCIINFVDGPLVKKVEVYGPKGDGKTLRTVTFILNDAEVYENLKRRFDEYISFGEILKLSEENWIEN